MHKSTIKSVCSMVSSRLIFKCATGNNNMALVSLPYWFPSPGKIDSTCASSCTSSSSNLSRKGKCEIPMLVFCKTIHEFTISRILPRYQPQNQRSKITNLIWEYQIYSSLTLLIVLVCQWTSTPPAKNGNLNNWQIIESGIKAVNKHNNLISAPTVNCVRRHLIIWVTQ